MYKKGDAKLLINRAAMSELDMDSHYDICTGDDHVSASEVANCRQVAALPHSCDRWVIGGYGQIRQMIFDLQGLLEELEETAPMIRTTSKPPGRVLPEE